MDFLRRLANGQINRETAAAEFIAALSKCTQDINSTDPGVQKEAQVFLNYTIFKLPAPFAHKRAALEALLTKVEYHTIAEKIALLIQQTDNIYEKSELIAITKKYRRVDEDTKPTDPAGLLEHTRSLWKRGTLDKAVDQAAEILVHDQASVQEKLTMIHTVVNDCYNPEQKEALAKLLSPIYTFLQHTPMSYASVRDVLIPIFRIRNTTLQETNTRVFRVHMDQWASSTEKYVAGYREHRGVELYVINKAWQWVCDAIEFARPAGKETLWAYLGTWVTEPPFHPELPVREKFKYQFFACEFLLQSYRNEEQTISAEFLLGIAESDEYSTFIRGDALDVLLRNPVPRPLQDRVATIHRELRQVREDTARNLQLQAQELGNAAFHADIAGDEPGFGQAIEGTTFDDAQSVHATEVNEAIKESLLNLIKDDEVRGNTVYKVVNDIIAMVDTNNDIRATTEQRNKAKASLTRYIEDPAVFTTKRIKLSTVLVLVWNRIIRHKERTELEYRLISELSEAFNTCATGHLSRAVSVLVGYYPDIKQFASFETQLRDNIKARINAVIRKTPEDLQGDLLIGMTDTQCPEYKIYINFTDKIRTPIYQELYVEFIPKYLNRDTFDKIFLETWPH